MSRKRGWDRVRVCGALSDETCRALSSATTCSGASPTGQQLSYDAEGRLTSWQNAPGNPPTAAVNYLYDGSGNRVAMQTTTTGVVNNTGLTTYIGSIEEVQVSSGTTGATTTTYYSVGGKRIAANVNGTFYYFGYDALGSQVAVFNNSGNLIGSQLYGPYGNQLYSAGTLPTSIGFTGQQADSVTGLDYYNARYYDPVSGVFLSVDLIQGNALGLNPYAYASGNPETLIDSTGHDTITLPQWMQEAEKAASDAWNQYEEFEPIEKATLDVVCVFVCFTVVVLVVVIVLVLLTLPSDSTYPTASNSQPKKHKPITTNPTSTKPKAKPKPQTSNSGAGQRGNGRGGGGSCTAKDALANFSVNGGHVIDHMLFNERAQNDHFTDSDGPKFYSYFDSVAEGVRAARIAIMYGRPSPSGSATVFRYTFSSRIGTISWVRDNVIHRAPAYTVTVVFNSNCQPVTIYIDR